MQRNDSNKEHLAALSALTFAPSSDTGVNYVRGLKDSQRAELLALAQSNHVVLRAFKPLLDRHGASCPADLRQFCQQVTSDERNRIGGALPVLHEICHEFQDAGYPLVVIKTLDHWPDFGNDIDLYTPADEGLVRRIFQEKFNAGLVSRSWGDHLANKWNFAVPGIVPQVEVHVQRLGQAGEHLHLARRVAEQSVPLTANGYTFQVPAPEERVIAATLQRMYRHLYFRLCDVLNTATLVEADAIDYEKLRRAADLGGIWWGVATYLTVALEYFTRFSGRSLPLPAAVAGSAMFKADKLFVRGQYIHVPVLPQGMTLYQRQWMETARRADLSATLRLSMVPPLASAAALSYAIFGSCERIW